MEPGSSPAPSPAAPSSVFFLFPVYLLLKITRTKLTPPKEGVLPLLDVSLL